MIKFSGVSTYTAEIEDKDFGFDLVEDKYQVPKGVEIFEITGLLFFGAFFVRNNWQPGDERAKGCTPCICTWERKCSRYVPRCASKSSDNR